MDMAGRSSGCFIWWPSLKVGSRGYISIYIFLRYTYTPEPHKNSQCFLGISCCGLSLWSISLFYHGTGEIVYRHQHQHCCDEQWMVKKYESFNDLSTSITRKLWQPLPKSWHPLPTPHIHQNPSNVLPTHSIPNLPHDSNPPEDERKNQRTEKSPTLSKHPSTLPPQPLATITHYSPPYARIFPSTKTNTKPPQNQHETNTQIYTRTHSPATKALLNLLSFRGGKFFGKWKEAMKLFMGKVNKRPILQSSRGCIDGFLLVVV